MHRRRLDRVLEPARNLAYDEVVVTPGTIAPLYGRAEESAPPSPGIPAGYKRRRNLMARLDRAGL